MNSKEFVYLGERYLTSNACGRWDGSVKAETHRNLSILITAEYFDVSHSDAEKITYDGKKSVWKMIRESTLPLTDNLDESIGFPIDSAPNYRRLTPLFCGEFKRLSTEWFQDQVSILSKKETEKLLTKLCENKISMMFTALDSYGFDFVDGCNKGAWLVMRSKIGIEVKITTNEYFGCKYELLTT